MQNLRAMLASAGPIFQIRHAEKLPLRTSYVDIAARVMHLLQLVPGGEVCLDATGVGAALADVLVAANIAPLRVIITGGTEITRHGPSVVHAPKVVLVAKLQSLLFQGRLRIHREIPIAADLTRELADFKIHYTPTGALSYAAKSGAHDDLVMALSVAILALDDTGMSSAGIFHLYKQRAAELRGVPLLPREAISLDPGQANDPCAIVVCRRVDAPVGVTAREVEPEALPHQEPAPEKVYAEGSSQWQEQQAPARPGFWLVSHPDPTASLGIGQPGPDPGTWIVPAGAVDDLASHGFKLVSFLPSPAEAEPASGQPSAA
jgi:hypothetical protein